jgi:hypothetical protein
LHDLAESGGELVRTFGAHELQTVREAIALVEQSTVRISTS